MKTKDPAFAAPTRLMAVALSSLMVIVGLLMLALGLLMATLLGPDPSWIVAAVGLIFLVVGVLCWIAMLPTRRTPGPAVEAGGGVALPLRRGYARRQALLAVVIGLGLLVGTVTDEDLGILVVAVPVMVVACVLLAFWFLFGGADSLRIVLTPDVLALPSGCGLHHLVPWDEIDEVQTLPRWQPVLVVTLKGEEATPRRVRLLAQGWSPATLTTAIEHYAKHPDRRSELTSAAAVEAVAFGAPTPIAPGPRR